MSCSKCIPQNDTAKEKARTARRRKEMGCVEDAPWPVFTDEHTGKHLYRCPLSQLKMSDHLAIEAYSDMENGFLPFEGGLWNQPAAFLARTKLVRAEKNAMDRKAHEEQQRKNNNA